ncbi:MAG TPA: tRNA (adenosine(37)-N6)-threonylcarbamoyltransferase complex transferase subunit TsaD [Chitinophagaceae bacterium]|nr:tRNA (adenosine(37)-N6)-threonylcarbamoyltransferase complex transferase subunit TsaD [Chitinophagaceae bacterium]
MVSSQVNILAIESSCDDTSAAVISNGKVLSNLVANQKVHEQYGGVVPEMASRAHMQNIVPVVEVALKQAGITKDDINAVAFTRSPGLIGSLLVGACFAKSFAQALSLPLLAIHHMQAHVLAHFIDEPHPQFPFLCLTVSGGHTQLVLCRSQLDMEVIGETQDDAAGEAFDKTAKMLGLPYPGGPVVDKLAQTGDPSKYTFPISEIKGYDFSFSGIKTAVLYFLQEKKKSNANFIEENINDVCASVQFTIIKTLLGKFANAARAYNVHHLGIAGGVSANSALRAAFSQMCAENGWQAHIPQFQYCTDNAAMIGIAGYYKYLAGEFADLSISPTAKASWR